MRRRGITRFCFILSGGYNSEFLDLCEEVFDHMLSFADFGIGHSHKPGRHILWHERLLPLCLLGNSHDCSVENSRSKLGSSLMVLKTRSNTPASAHLQNRGNWLFKLPKLLGTSHHGKSVQTRQTAASKKHPIVLCRSATIAGRARQLKLNPLPQTVKNRKSAFGHSNSILKD